MSEYIGRGKSDFPEDQNNDQFITGSDAYKARRIEKKLIKQGQNCLALLFNHLDNTEQEFFHLNVKRAKDELPVFGFFESLETWMFATTRQVVWSRPGFTHSLKYGQIENFGHSELLELGPAPDPTKEGWRTEWESLCKIIFEIRCTSRRFYFSDKYGGMHEALLPAGKLDANQATLSVAIQLDRIHPVQP